VRCVVTPPAPGGVGALRLPSGWPSHQQAAGLGSPPAVIATAMRSLLAEVGLFVVISEAAGQGRGRAGGAASAVSCSHVCRRRCVMWSRHVTVPLP